MNNISSSYKYVLLIWTFVVLIVYALIVNEKNTSVNNIAKNTIKSSLNKDTMFRYWVTSHGGVYVKATKRTPPNIHLSHIKNRDIVTKDFNLTLMNPAYTIRQMMSEYEGLYGLKGHITSLKVFNKKYNAPDDWEKKVLSEVEKSRKTDIVYEKVEKDGKKYLRAFEPLIATKDCLKCHGIQGYKVGDIRGGVSVTLPLDELLDEKNSVILRIFLYFTVIYIIGLVLIRFFYKKVLIKIKEEKRLKDELINSEKYFREVVNTAKNTIVINQGEEIENANKAFYELTGFKTLDEFKKKYKSICDLFINEDGYITEEVNGEYWLDYIYENQDILHKAMINKENIRHTFLIYVNKFQLDGKYKYVIVLNDITDIIKKDDMMMTQSRHAIMGEMISMIAHQWRQPISTIAMSVNTLLADVDIYDKVENEEVKRASYLILDQTQHLSKTIDDFKNFFVPNRITGRVNVNDVIDDALGIIGKSLENNNIELIKEYKSETQIDIFSRELLQVTINIIKNAKEALLENSIENAKIEVCTYEDDKSVFIKICDNGKGIDKSITDKIFEPYFTTKDEKSGTGLGLYMSKTIVEKHLHGTIECFNENGACFKIKLPKE